MIATYLADVQASLEQILVDRIVNLTVFGSWAFDDFQPSSDLDLMCVVGCRLDQTEKERIVATLMHSRRPCPAHGLDFGIYRLDQLNPVHREPEHELGFATGAEWDDEPEYGGLYPGGIVDLELMRRHGRTIFGPSAAGLIGPVPRAWLEEEVRRTLLWHRSKLHDPFHDPFGANAVLNACRAWSFMAEGEFVSKSAGANWALKRSVNPEVVRQAVQIREGKASLALERSDVLSLLDEVEGHLR